MAIIFIVLSPSSFVSVLSEFILHYQSHSFLCFSFCFYYTDLGFSEQFHFWGYFIRKSYMKSRPHTSTASIVFSSGIILMNVKIFPISTQHRLHNQTTYAMQKGKSNRLPVYQKILISGYRQTPLCRYAVTLRVSKFDRSNSISRKQF